ncbi:DUF3800 domain-containing protein [Phaeocystidibacter luteus]|uniref:DUF3800 domain-containing protein n=1 Tax=Phaeocystidibacter luteus TaxID=911197 RepID=A0A6N6REM3_9FLAO|nr:DUF3800 domain-containing protein [Phaeocystidibacter luteus]KAB2805312.1 DUF3800 domain-containing protein [Phaeocystidibacter luteus]
MNNQIAFIDEFGNNGLEFDSEGVSTHFIVTAIIIDKDKLELIEKQVDEIRGKHFQKGEMKSSKLKDNDTRRLRVLEDLNKLEFHIFSVVIDKRELKGEGFNFKGPFFKFLHSLVDRELFSVFPDILVVADEHGGKEFKEGFIKYINKKHIPDLFNQSEFRFSNSKSDLVVQVADIITGTLARCYESKKLSENRSKLLETLKSKITEIRFWPPDYRPFAFNPEKDYKNYDPTISTLGINLAEQHLDKNKKSKIPFEIDQCSCLSYLLFHFKNINPESYVPTYELIEQIEKVRVSTISMHYFRSKIIAKLRDHGVVISSSNKGYKLPSSKNDLFDFVNHSNSYIQPMIDRLMKCRNKVKLATKNELDILDIDEFKYLKMIINNVP